jgi:hypothetical protein
MNAENFCRLNRTLIQHVAPGNLYHSCVMVRHMMAAMATNSNIKPQIDGLNGVFYVFLC